MSTLTFLTSQKSRSLEDQIICDELEKRSISYLWVDWKELSQTTSLTQTYIVRSTWDYHKKINSFLGQLQWIHSSSKLINSYPTILWNHNKNYLLNTNKKEIPYIPTKIITNIDIELEKIQRPLAHGEKFILKPTVSASADGLYLISKTTCLKELSSLIKKEQSVQYLLQPFMESILTKHETSFILFNGIFSHAVKKSPKKGDFRVQGKYGGSYQPYQPQPNEVDLIHHIYSQLNINEVYARIDTIYDENNNLNVMEIELIEPQLFLETSSTAVQKFIDSLLLFA